MPNVDWNTLNAAISMAATVAFAVTAVLPLRGANGVDLLGATVLALITAIGGGTVRDVILDVPVFWSQDLSYIWAATGAAVAAFYGRRLFSTRYLYSRMLYLDGFGAAMFGIQAAGKVWDLGFGLPAAPVILGVVTAIGGGLIRDTLAGRTTLLMRPELYATPVLLGCTAFVLVLAYLPRYTGTGAILCIAGTFVMRAAAIHWDLAMPGFARRAKASSSD